MSADRTQPTFLIPGAMRSGTTALTSWLRLHPGVFISPTKEVHYFDRHYDRGPEWYADHFTARHDEVAAGEATPNYLYDGDAVARIAADLPGVRLVVLLRDPVDRAYSHYLHRVSREGEPLSFSEALAAEPERLAGGDALDRAHFSYADRGHYLGQLERLLAHFPREAVQVHLFEDLRDSPVEVFRSVVGFLGADPEQVPDGVGTQANAYQQFRSARLRRLTKRLPKAVGAAVGRLNRVQVEEYPTPPADAVERLLAAYAPERAALAELIGRDLHEWRG